MTSAASLPFSMATKATELAERLDALGLRVLFHSQGKFPGQAGWLLLKGTGHAKEVIGFYKTLTDVWEAVQ